VHDILKRNYAAISGTFTYYAAVGGGSPYHMALNAYTTLLDDAGVPDNEAPYIKRSDCDTIFIVCNFVPDKKSPEAMVSAGHARCGSRGGQHAMLRAAGACRPL
jgi:hypothetical protein